MAEDKKRNALFSRLLNKKPSDDKCFESEEEFSDNNDPELNENAENNEAENNSTLEWLSDVMTESPEEPEEDDDDDFYAEEEVLEDDVYGSDFYNDDEADE